MKIIDKIFTDKNYKSGIYILLAVGIIITISGTIFAPKTPDTQSEMRETPTLEDESLDIRLEAILSQIYGAGEVKVFCSFSSGEKAVFERDTDGKSKKTVVLNSGGKETALVAQTVPAELGGIIIVADGAKKAGVRAALIKAVQAVTDVPPHKIAVFEREEKQ